MPVTSALESATAAARDLIHALQSRAGTPLLPPTHHAALTQLATIFQDFAPEPAAPTLPPPDDPTAEPPRVPMPTADPPRVPIDAPTALPPNLPTILPIDPASLPVASPRVATYTSQTGNPAKRRRAARKAKRQSSSPPAVIPVPPPPASDPVPVLPPPVPVIPKRSSQRNQGRVVQFDPLTHQRTTFITPASCGHLVVPVYSANHAEPGGPPEVRWYVACAVIDPLTGSAQTFQQLKVGPDGHLWLASAANEIGRLAQGNLPHMPTGTETMHFIPHSALPPGRSATYLRIVAEIKPHKEETRRIRFTVGGNRIDYPGKVATPTADLTTAKLLFNSVISTKDAQFAAFDITNFYLNNPMLRFEYMRIPVRDIPPSIMTQYNLSSLVHNGHVLVEIRKGMYGLSQAMGSSPTNA